MKRYCAAALLLTVFGLPAFAARAGSDAMPFLKLDSGARAAALAGAYCASGDDALSVFYNPAGAAVAARKEFVFSHTEWLQGIRHESLGYVHPLSRNSTVFGSANMLVSGEMVKFNAAGSSVGSFSANDYAFGGGFASALGRRFYGAIGMKLFYQKADGNGATGWGGDAGLLKLYEDFRFGFSASNIGGRLKMGATTLPYPRRRRGASADVQALRAGRLPHGPQHQRRVGAYAGRRAAQPRPPLRLRLRPVRRPGRLPPLHAQVRFRRQTHGVRAHRQDQGLRHPRQGYPSFEA